MTTIARKIGDRAEDLALQFLIEKGLRLLAKNYTLKTGEIDLIMEDKDQVVFVEVRYRSSKTHGGAAASILKGKRKRIIQTATLYLQFNNWLYKRSSRFDVIAIDKPGDIPVLNWYKNAFTP